jgi:transposase
MTGEVQFRKKLTRVKFRMLLAKQEPRMVIFEAFGSASYWARELETMGHELKLIAPLLFGPS